MAGSIAKKFGSRLGKHSGMVSLWARIGDDTGTSLTHLGGMLLDDEPALETFKLPVFITTRQKAPPEEYSEQHPAE